METPNVNTMDARDIKKELRTWIEIDTKAIDHNVALVRKLLPKDTKIMAVVKSNAYGHGFLDFAAHVSKMPGQPISWFGCDSITEALALRKEGITLPILVMGYSLPKRFADAVASDISITISSFDALKNLLEFSDSQKLKIHIKIDTGLHRQGFLPEEIPDLLEMLQKNTGRLMIQGLYTHFADAKRQDGIDFTHEQKNTFEKVHAQFTEAGFKVLTHVSASPGVMRFGPEGVEGEDLVRLGAVLYGLYPSDDMRVEYQKKFVLQPSLTWKTIISELKKIPKGSAVGYNRSEIVSRDTVIGVCPIGYWHGYPGSLSSKGIVMVNGTPAKILGRVSMDMITIDCTDCKDALVGDEVVLIDGDIDSPASVWEVAAKSGVFTHELLTRLNSRIKRIYS